jgi:hypothetical protein
VQAWVVFLLVMHHVPVERCADVIGALTSLFNHLCEVGQVIPV